MPQEDSPPTQGMSPVARAAVAGGPLADLMYPFDFSKRGDDFFGGGGGPPGAGPGRAGGPAGGGSGSAATGAAAGSSLSYLSGVGYLGTGPGAISGGYDDHDYGYKAPASSGRSPSPTPPPQQKPQVQPAMQRPAAAPSPVAAAPTPPGDDRGGSAFWTRDSGDNYSAQDRDSYG